jgi:hypothetical protein
VIPFELLRSPLRPSHYVAPSTPIAATPRPVVRHYDTTMPADLPSDEVGSTLQVLVAQMSSLGSQVEQLQRHIDGTTNPTTPTNSTTPANPTTPATPMKSEKLPDPLMFSGSREDLRPFVSKLRIKLDMNADPFPTERSKLVYGLSRLDGDAARTMDSFYRNGGFRTLEDFIVSP